MPAKSIKVPASLSRAATIIRGEDGKPDMMSISSDVPYKRYDYWNDEEYYEILGHGPEDIDDERLKAGLSICFNHDRDKPLATAGGFINDGHKLSLKISDFKWTRGQFTEDKKADMESGALPYTSVSYELIGDGICVGAQDELPVYKFRWKPFEAGPVVIPADISVGVGRSREKAPNETPREISIKSLDESGESAQTTSSTSQNQDSLKPNMKLTPLARAHFMAPDNGGGTGGAGGGAVTLEVVDAKKEREAALKEYKERCRKIRDFVGGIKIAAWKTKAEEIAARHIEGEADFEDFRTEANSAFTTETAIETPQRSEIQVLGPRGGQRGSSIGSQFINLKAFKDCGGHIPRGSTAGLEFPGVTMLGIRGKIAMAQRAGFASADLSAVNVQIQTGLVGLGVQRLTIMDVLSPGAIGAGSLVYPRENSFGSVDDVAVAAGKFPRAKAVGERGVKPNWDADLTTETATVRKIAITTKVPDEFMADFPAVQSYIDERLPYMVDLEAEFQMLYGDGLNSNLKGIFTNAGVQTRAIDATSDTTIAASLKKGLTDIQVNAQFQPDFYAFHPYDWETASLLKDTAGRFLAGGPFYIPYTAGVFMEVNTFWGKPVVVTTSVTYGQPIAGAGKLGAQFFIREGMRIESTNSNEDDWKRNLICLRAEERLALATYRPVAFLEFTGFPARA